MKTKSKTKTFLRYLSALLVTACLMFNEFIQVKLLESTKKSTVSKNHKSSLFGTPCYPLLLNSFNYQYVFLNPRNSLGTEPNHQQIRRSLRRKSNIEYPKNSNPVAVISKTNDSFKPYFENCNTFNYKNKPIKKFINIFTSGSGGLPL